MAKAMTKILNKSQKNPPMEDLDLFCGVFVCVSIKILEIFKILTEFQNRSNSFYLSARILQEPKGKKTSHFKRKILRADFFYKSNPLIVNSSQNPMEIRS